MTTWFTSDQHFGHRNICELSRRPFMTMEAMEATLIELFNERVQSDDLVFHLGDFGFYGNAGNARILAAMNGRHVLILGNHDGTLTAARTVGFSEVYYAAAIELDGRRLFLRHIPPDECRGDDPRKFADKYHMEPPADIDIFLCGHVHEKFQTHHKWRRPVVNVGVDRWGFAPVTLDQILAVVPNITHADHP